MSRLTGIWSAGIHYRFSFAAERLFFFISCRRGKGGTKAAVRQTR
jgi:hypothetical protein